MRNTARMPLPGPQGNWVASLLLAAAFVPARCTGPRANRRRTTPVRFRPQKRSSTSRWPTGLRSAWSPPSPQVRQPLSISFDDRGRMWVMQYLQYPNPDGLKPVEVDHYLRTKYDRVPEPPPKGPKGPTASRSYEDTDGDGRADVVKDFVTGSEPGLRHGARLRRRVRRAAAVPAVLRRPRPRRRARRRPRSAARPASAWKTRTPLPTRCTWGPDGWLYGARAAR